MHKDPCSGCGHLAVAIARYQTPTGTVIERTCDPCLDHILEARTSVTVTRLRLTPAGAR